MRGRRMENNLYKMEGSVVVREFDAAAAVQDQQGAHRLWHYSLGHMEDRGMKELSKRGLISDLDRGIWEVCEPCQIEKLRRVQFDSSLAYSAVPLELVHTDISGPALVSTRNGVRYFLTFINIFLRKVWVYFMKEKSEVFIRFKVWKAEVEKETSRSLKCLRLDNGGEYTSRKF